VDRPSTQLGGAITGDAALLKRLRDEAKCPFHPAGGIEDRGAEQRQSADSHRIAWRQQRNRAAEQVLGRGQVAAVVGPRARASQQLRRAPSGIALVRQVDLVSVQLRALEVVGEDLLQLATLFGRYAPKPVEEPLVEVRPQLLRHRLIGSITK